VEDKEGKCFVGLASAMQLEAASLTKLAIVICHSLHKTNIPETVRGSRGKVRENGLEREWNIW
jgi:hypothetical protein